MPGDIERLVTRLPKDKGYSRANDIPAALGGFVCPRADGHGRREGVIPPGIAAQRGLVPAKLHRVTLAEATANAASRREEAAPESEMYLDYYGSSHASSEVPHAADDRVPPPPAAPEARRVAGGHRAPAFAKKPPVVFSKPEKEVYADDTLDGFYAGLKGTSPGTDEEDMTPPARPVGKAGRPGRGKKRTAAGKAAQPRTVARTEQPSAPPEDMFDEADAVSAASSELDALMSERDALIEASDVLTAQRDSYASAYEETARKLEELKRELTEKSASERRYPDHGTVRVNLGSSPVRLKLGGRGEDGSRWEVNVMGHLDYSRSRDEVVLTVLDTGYASELLGSLARGDVVIVSATGRTTCHYDGLCDKIYGENGSPDFITLVRMAVTGDGGA